MVKSPEALRIYVGSFWDQPLVYDDNAELFQMEEKDLMKDLKELPRSIIPCIHPPIHTTKTVLALFYVM